MIQQFKLPNGDIVIVQGEMQIMAAHQKGWEPVFNTRKNPMVSDSPENALILSDIAKAFEGRGHVVTIGNTDFDLERGIISGKTKRRATTADFTIDPATGRIIIKKGE